ncbi:MAG: arginine N-succinyltransferase, partial [Phycisphaeraceae bacterium]|nr:arginine N-succinyltransferase [Phycisphaeraceae bacterium]
MTCVLRPVFEDDVDGIYGLTELTGYGLTTLPRDRDWLAERVAEARAGFEKVPGDQPGGELYLFVLEDTTDGSIAGVSGIVSKVGGFEPFYAYRIETEHHHSDALDIDKTLQTLHLVTEHNGPCEIGSLFLHPDHRGRGLGRLLSLGRFLFV